LERGAHRDCHDAGTAIGDELFWAGADRVSQLVRGASIQGSSRLLEPSDVVKGNS
jgi:hypothetical protein